MISTYLSAFMSKITIFLSVLIMVSANIDLDSLYLDSFLLQKISINPFSDTLIRFERSVVTVKMGNDLATKCSVIAIGLSVAVAMIFSLAVFFYRPPSHHSTTPKLGFNNLIHARDLYSQLPPYEPKRFQTDLTTSSVTTSSSIMKMVSTTTSKSVSTSPSTIFIITFK